MKKWFMKVFPDWTCCWVSIRLDGAVPPVQVEALCRRSYELVFAKLPKKVRLEIQGEGTHAGNAD